VRGLGRRRAALLLQAAEDRTAGGHSHVGRAGRHAEHTRDDRWRGDHGAVARVLRHQRPLGDRERGDRPRHRGRDHTGRRGHGTRLAARTRGTGGAEAAGADAGETRAASGAGRSHHAAQALVEPLNRSGVIAMRLTLARWRSRLTVATIVAFGLGVAGLATLQPAEPALTLAEVMIPMRDGTRLFAQIYRPANAAGPLPIVFQRTPYGVGQNTPAGVASALIDLPADGYIIVLQDIRGRFKSEGQFVMLRQPRPSLNSGRPEPVDRADPKAIDESTDTYDTIEWLLKNVPGNNGRVGMVGTSYPAWL